MKVLVFLKHSRWKYFDGLLLLESNRAGHNAKNLQSTTGYTITYVVIAAVIFLGTWGLFKDSVHLALHAVPPDIDFEDVRDTLASFSNVMICIFWRSAQRKLL